MQDVRLHVLPSEVIAMPEWLIRLLIALVPLLLGGSLYAAFVRPRVYLGTRLYSTARALPPGQRKRILDVLDRERVPTAFIELEWWNAGRRAATDIAIEVTTPGEILTHELAPYSEDLAAGWRLSEPLPGTAASPNRLRIIQASLMPDARTSLIVGYAPTADDEEDPQARAFLKDRPVRPWARSHSIYEGLVGLLAMGGCFLVGGVLESWRPFGPKTVGLGILIGLAALVPLAWLAPRLLSPLRPGRPSWESTGKRP
jgi:hypothetical protein